MVNLTDKLRANFNLAAKNYEKSAALQKLVGWNLIRQIEKFAFVPKKIVDLGCGTGLFTLYLKTLFSDAKIISIDIADKMLTVAKDQDSSDDKSFICADFNYMPLQNRSMDLVFSNLSLQWSCNLHLTFLEIARVLKNDGNLVFSTLGHNSLSELRQCWANIDSDVHANIFLAKENIEQQLRASRFLIKQLISKKYVFYYPDINQLLLSFKAIGANYVIAKRSKGLMGKNRWDCFLAKYEKYKCKQDQLPVTYEVIFVSAVKKV